MRELPFAELVPLWRHVREEGVTALITPACDYVGAVQVGHVDIRYAGQEAIDSLGEQLRSLVGGLDDGSVLHFLYRVDLRSAEADIAEYETMCSGPDRPAALRAYVAARAAWLRQQPLRSTRCYLFFSGRPRVGLGLGRGQLGVKLRFTDPEDIRLQEHQHRLKELAQLRDRLVNRLSQIGIPARELDLADMRRIHYELLNPGRAKAGIAPPSVTLRQNLWSEDAFRSIGHHLREYTEAEQLVLEDLEDGRGHFLQGGRVRRAVTLKLLPEAGTSYFAGQSFARLATRDERGQDVPFAYWLAVTVHVRSQRWTRKFLSNRHTLVNGLRNAIPFLKSSSVDKDAADAAQQASIEGLFRELNEMSSKIVSLSVSMLLEADTLDQLERQTESARSAFASAGNSEMMVEDVAQVPAFLSMLPGAGGYQHRRKGCTSRNGGDFLPLFGPWRGTKEAASILSTPEGDLFRLHLFDKKLSPSHHGVVFADTGSGKSMSLGFLTLDALASGSEAILIDNGASWKEFTELLGGTLADDDVEDALRFIEVCVVDRSMPGFDKLQEDTITRAIRWCYEERFRHRPEERPLISDFRDALLQRPWDNDKDKQIAEQIALRLRIYCDGVYAEFLNRPSKLRFDAPLLTFDIQAVSQSPTAKSIAMATIIQAIGNRAARRKTRTLVEVDEGHEHLGQDDVGERFLAGAYRRFRKYGISMYLISQKLRDFTACKAGPAIVGNSHIKIFLRHGSGHEEVAEYFGLSNRAAAAFKNLQMRGGYYSDFMLLYGDHTTVLRLAPHPLAYWLLTTDAEDRALLAAAGKKNPHFSRLELLQELAARYPHGVMGATTARQSGKSNAA